MEIRGWPVGELLVVVHAVCGVLLLVVGAATLLAPKRRRSPHPWLGRLYMVLLLVVLPSGMVIGARTPGLSAFEIATPPTLAAGLLGLAAVRGPLRRRLGRAWRAWHLVAMGSSFIGVLTASALQLVLALDDATGIAMAVAWSAPTVIGSAMIARALAAERRRGRAGGRARGRPGGRARGRAPTAV